MDDVTGQGAGAPSIAGLTAEARDALAADNILLVEAAAQEILRIDPGDGFANAVMAHCARLIGLDALAGRWTGAAAAEPFRPVVNPAIAALQAGCGASRYDERFLLIRGWGYGFWADVFHVLGGLLLAEASGRIPFVLWGGESLFAPPGCDNAFPLFFRPFDPAVWSMIRRAPSKEVFPGKWRTRGVAAPTTDRAPPSQWGGPGQMGALWLLNRPERVVVSDFFIGAVDVLPWLPEGHPLHGRTLDVAIRDLVARYLVPQPRIAETVEAFRNGPLAGRPSAAFHVRGSDKVTEVSRLAAVNALYLAQAERAAERGYALWLMTDDAQVSADWHARFGDAVVCQDALRVDGKVGVHYATARDARERVGAEVLIDVLVGAGCDRFIGNGRSNPSCMVDFLMEGDETRKHLFLPNQNRQRFLGFYRDRRADAARY